MFWPVEGWTWLRLYVVILESLLLNVASAFVFKWWLHFAYLGLAEVVQEIEVVCVDFLSCVFFSSTFFITISFFTFLALALGFGRLISLSSTTGTVALVGLWQRFFGNFSVLGASLNLQTFRYWLWTGRTWIHCTMHLCLVSHHLKRFTLSAQGAKIWARFLKDNLAKLAGDFALSRFIDLDLYRQRYHIQLLNKF